jgi:hypothetical protein
VRNAYQDEDEAVAIANNTIMAGRGVGSTDEHAVKSRAACRPGGHQQRHVQRQCAVWQLQTVGQRA